MGSTREMEYHTTDAFEAGQWFNGRIYERWSDSTYALWGQCFAVIAMCSGSLTALMHCPARAG